MTTEPKYRQIAADLRAAINDRDYLSGDRLPGENDLMARYQVARMTARQALGVLLNEGLAVARKGSGIFVRDFAPIIGRASRASPTTAGPATTLQAPLCEAKTLADSVDNGHQTTGLLSRSAGRDARPADVLPASVTCGHPAG